MARTFAGSSDENNDFIKIVRGLAALSTVTVVGRKIIQRRRVTVKEVIGGITAAAALWAWYNAS
jgi:hypothetical protein